MTKQLLDPHHHVGCSLAIVAAGAMALIPATASFAGDDEKAEVKVKVVAKQKAGKKKSNDHDSPRAMVWVTGEGEDEGEGVFEVILERAHGDDDDSPFHVFRMSPDGKFTFDEDMDFEFDFTKDGNAFFGGRPHRGFVMTPDGRMGMTDDEEFEFHWVGDEDEDGPRRRVLRRRVERSGGGEKNIRREVKRFGPGGAHGGDGNRWVFDGDDGENVFVIEIDGESIDMGKLHEHLSKSGRVRMRGLPEGAMRWVERSGDQPHGLIERILTEHGNQDADGTHEFMLRMLREHGDDDDHESHADHDDDGPHGQMRMRFGDDHADHDDDGPHGQMKIRIGDGEDIHIEMEQLHEILQNSMGQIHEALQRELGDEHAGGIEEMIREHLHKAMQGHMGGDEKDHAEHEVHIEMKQPQERTLRRRVERVERDSHAAREHEVLIERLEGARASVEDRQREHNVVIDRLQDDRTDARVRQRARRRTGAGSSDLEARATRIERRMDRLEQRIEQLLERLERRGR